MDFDKTRVYTAANADELKVGSKCIFADTIEELEDAVKDKQSACISKLKRITERGCVFRFVCENNSEHNLAYLLDLPKEKLKEREYKPFSNIEKAMEAIQKHGGWVKSKNGDISLIICYAFDNVLVAGKHIVFYDELLQYFVFADDGTPCGELVEI